MQHRIISLLGTFCIALTMQASDTLMLAKRSSKMAVTLPNGSIECIVEAEMPVNGNKGVLQTLNDKLNAIIKKATAQYQSAATTEESSTSWPLTVGAESNVISKMLAASKYGTIRGGQSLDITMLREYETSKIISFRIEVVYYGIGNQRSQRVSHVSILKQNGKTMTWANIIQKKSKPRFCKAVATSMESFFGVRDFINLRQQLKGGNQLKAESFPLPEGDMAVNSDGLCFTYMPGEIAAEEKGQPIGTLSLQKVWSMLTPEAKKVLR